MAKVLGIIPARGGSKRLPGKNIRLFNGWPLFTWTITEANKCSDIEHVVVSSDSKDIRDIAKVWGCEAINRSPELATETATTLDVVMDVIEQYPDFDYAVLLQPTSPLRTAQDIRAVLDLAKNGKPCVSVYAAKDWTFRMDGWKLYPAQGPIYILNGAVYAASYAWLKEHKRFLHPDTVAYVMPPERSIDIDTEYDFKMAEAIAPKRDMECLVDGIPVQLAA